MNGQFMTMYEEYFDDVYRFVLYKTGNRWDTDDLVSEIFRKAFQHFNQNRVELERMKPWLFTIARNTVIDHYRKRKEWAYGHDPEVFGYTHTTELLETIDLQNDCLKQSLLSLTTEEREMINLKYIAEMKYSEISGIVGKAEMWMKTKVHRIKQKMALLINKCMEAQK
ncbi:RNA polymerase sigma factor [Cohnella abietis]|uniref:ECF RNA polymerase sigma factor SigM n=1 Tax=Cohnella abietis TaxID=2507935 RepID=A0A3T1D5S0_9BACL|nr:sigma-70 family RNA polymerase sigma factor [Cohnella abietis]BBI33388.1 ECF RNA polymerase sigma factor SigM [Cohnella abietis]